MSDCILHQKYIKKALRKNLFPDNFTVSRYSFSPYMACGHGCAYCDGRAEKYYVVGDFDRDIVVRKNIENVLLKELSNLREKGPVTISSGVTDAYQPAEEQTELTRKCLEVLSYFDLPVNLLTKSDLIERDLDILSKIALSNNVSVFISLVHLDDRIRKIFEPYAASVESRLKLIGKLKNAGCSVGILAMPFLPFIGDSESHVRTLFTSALKEGADFIMPGYLTLRPGRQKDYYLTRIKEYFPQYLDDYRQMYSNNLQSGNPIKKYRDDFTQLSGEIVESMKFDTMVPHRVYGNSLHSSDELFVLLCQLKENYDRKGIETTRLSRSIHSYAKYIEKVKKELGRDIARNTEFLDKLIPDLCRTGKINTILKNEKLSFFISKIFLENKTFDFKTMNLV
ncbi:MAG: radical SAM protein [Spirochaetaceae bacterium]|nr:radical SAM protein [Spirochaetaceae bacterium]